MQVCGGSQSFNVVNTLRLQFQLASPITQFSPVVYGTQYVVPISSGGTKIWNPRVLKDSSTLLIAGLSLGVVIGFLARTPQRRQMRLDKGNMGLVLEERNRIAQECHDTLMAGFSAVSWQLEATMNLFRDGNEAQSPAARSF